MVNLLFKLAAGVGFPNRYSSLEITASTELSEKGSFTVTFGDKFRGVCSPVQLTDDQGYIDEQVVAEQHVGDAGDLGSDEARFLLSNLK